MPNLTGNQKGTATFLSVLATLLAIGALTLAYVAYEKASNAFNKASEVESSQNQELERERTDTPQANEGVGNDGSVAPDPSSTVP
jgi:hypothetical protein